LEVIPKHRPIFVVEAQRWSPSQRLRFENRQIKTPPADAFRKHFHLFTMRLKRRHPPETEG
jgi:hypothetical protein